ncbi:hypothetical protein SARC_00208 [Sphaeroforma arctica JP610]|uniref:Uncharacterized protein n=1 Tax=Sphaeroforma arctica JP610 TaxID=667725 RepID=A0A0L0GFB5_9EUKA|nr:hypothetical protein SARC_00208 [Sphaeroforma arctica JP610]KNC87702.1 hypothetical protein SARC_00208 [Sphaeroforma arctica JP610]|eukprot:XP_014161604.1 hypothetical protein SARC_00208 [Sphaeroforma arctica JP610]
MPKQAHSRARAEAESEVLVRKKRGKAATLHKSDDDHPTADLLDRINTYAHARILAAGAVQEQEMFARAALYSLGVLAQELIREEVDLIVEGKAIDTKTVAKPDAPSTVIEDVD